MAGSDADRRAAGAVSTEEADRLSEQFKPSWEEEPAPRDPPPRAPAPRPAATPPAAAPRAPVVTVSAPKPSPPRTGVGSKSTPQETPLALKSPKRATLLGISPSPVPPSPELGRSPDDLDWEAPTNPLPPTTSIEPESSPRPAAGAPPDSASGGPTALVGDEIDVPVDVEELPPESKPSGIGEKYKPKDEGAPPVVLGEDVRAAEVGAQAQLEAEHRARRAPTIAKMKAIELPLPAAAEPEVDFRPSPKKGYGGLLVAAGVLMLAGAGGVLALALRGTPPSTATAPTAESAAPVATVTADTRAPAPPVVSAAEPAPGAAQGPADPPTVEAPPAVASAPAPVEAEPSAKAGKGKAGKPAAKTAAAKPQPPPRPAATSTKPSAPPAKPAAGKPAGKNVIVRDSPF